MGEKSDDDRKQQLQQNHVYVSYGRHCNDTVATLLPNVPSNVGTNNFYSTGRRLNHPYYRRRSRRNSITSAATTTGLDSCPEEQVLYNEEVDGDDASSVTTTPSVQHHLTSMDNNDDEHRRFHVDVTSVQESSVAETFISSTGSSTFNTRTTIEQSGNLTSSYSFPGNTATSTTNNSNNIMTITQQWSSGPHLSQQHNLESKLLNPFRRSSLEGNSHSNENSNATFPVQNHKRCKSENAPSFLSRAPSKVEEENTNDEGSTTSTSDNVAHEHVSSTMAMLEALGCQPSNERMLDDADIDLIDPTSTMHGSFRSSSTESTASTSSTKSILFKRRLQSRVHFMVFVNILLQYLEGIDAMTPNSSLAKSAKRTIAECHARHVAGESLYKDLPQVLEQNLREVVGEFHFSKVQAIHRQAQFRAKRKTTWSLPSSSPSKTAASAATPKRRAVQNDDARSVVSIDSNSVTSKSTTSSLDPSSIRSNTLRHQRKIAISTAPLLSGALCPSSNGSLSAAVVSVRSSVDKSFSTSTVIGDCSAVMSSLGKKRGMPNSTIPQVPEIPMQEEDTHEDESNHSRSSRASSRSSPSGVVRASCMMQKRYETANGLPPAFQIRDAQFFKKTRPDLFWAPPLEELNYLSPGMKVQCTIVPRNVVPSQEEEGGPSTMELDESEDQQPQQQQLQQEEIWMTVQRVLRKKTPNEQGQMVVRRVLVVSVLGRGVFKGEQVTNSSNSGSVGTAQHYASPRICDLPANSTVLLLPKHVQRVDRRSADILFERAQARREQVIAAKRSAK